MFEWCYILQKDLATLRGLRDEILNAYTIISRENHWYFLLLYLEQDLGVSSLYGS